MRVPALASGSSSIVTRDVGLASYGRRVPDLWIAPYLPLAASMDVGPWQFIAFEDFAQRHTRSRPVFNECRRLLTAYRLPRNLSTFGAVILPAEGRVGDEVPREKLGPLRLALTAALVDQNPSPLEEDDDSDPNAGLSMATPENAQLYAQPLTGSNQYVVSLGEMVGRLEMRSAPKGRPLPPVEPPVGLPTPTFRGSLDDEYVAALYATLSAGDRTANQLNRCIRWVGVAWSNEHVVNPDTRILAFRAAFDVLLGGGSQTRALGKALAELLGDTTALTEHSWTERGRAHSKPLNDTEWWFQSMALLRNAIAHGNDISNDEWLFDGQHHVWRADDKLRRAIKQTVIAAGHSPDLVLAPGERALKRAYAELAQEWREADTDVRL